VWIPFDLLDFDNQILTSTLLWTLCVCVLSRAIKERKEQGRKAEAMEA
jgi:hypothetical protein